MGMGNINITKFINYIQTTYRTRISAIEYEKLMNIAKEYDREELLQAVDYCKNKGTDSINYLEKTLANKYYKSNLGIELPKWCDEELIAQPLDEEEKEWARNFYYKYCDSVEEAEARIKENCLEG